MRPARALIDLDALRSNFQLARELGGGRKTLAAVKADAYGHGAVACARALQGQADAFGVACIEEALELRSAGITAPILLLEGFFEADELPLIVQHDLWFAVAAPWQVDAVAAFQTTATLQVWLKLDSGMHRLGLSPADFRAAHARLSALPQIAPMVLMSHMARADELDSARTGEQAAAFAAAIDGLAGETSLCNSPALLGWPDVRSDWVRPGLMLYGANPLPVQTAQTLRLRPVMTMQSKIFAVRQIEVGEPVGYGARFVAQRPTRVGVVALGYADGYPQFAPNGTPVLIDGQAATLIGRVSMDMLTVDLTDLPQAGIGSTVTLWGESPRLDVLAPLCGVSAYQLPCAVKRVPHELVGG
ncbi:alanine racemase [Stenotrophomonas rhizophila]|uniref:alanine racemase n=1 Tax=Stenotrophomonas rhizophila TaxID=216778 RepID=UPI001E38A876|nr:alanine racemase [Stenotrophomonas rhizophila]MCC7634134.1 alanine racemase [Stenotrophomonas rhizophila]MCC7662830.1 alanine racemase [Stenotrophomonas rhizophila]